MDLKFYTIQGCEHPEEERDIRERLGNLVLNLIHASDGELAAADRPLQTSEVRPRPSQRYEGQQFSTSARGSGVLLRSRHATVQRRGQVRPVPSHDVRLADLFGCSAPRRSVSKGHQVKRPRSGQDFQSERHTTTRQEFRRLDRLPQHCSQTWHTAEAVMDVFSEFHHSTSHWHPGSLGWGLGSDSGRQ
jgi:hypothetical protein